MKIRISILVLLLIGIYSCDSKSENLQEIEKIETENKEMTSFHCYQFTNGKDSISLHYQRDGNEIKGWMNYDFFEKDGSIGEVEGEISGDTLKLEYKFLAEGTISEMEVFFLKRDNYKLYRGSGEMVMTNDSVMIYSNPFEIKFTDNMPLGELKNCSEDLIKQSDKKFYMEFKSRN
ncbi:hypothetical protein [Moheibacter sp.]|uniref:hypothetical protein n=1 Tax=Moheibacter sp. TaxID=1965316 RepID=UPI003C787DCE